MSMPAAHSNRIGSRSRAQVEVYSPFVSCHGGGAGLSHGIRKKCNTTKNDREEHADLSPRWWDFRELPRDHVGSDSMFRSLKKKLSIGNKVLDNASSHRTNSKLSLSIVVISALATDSKESLGPQRRADVTAAAAVDPPSR